MRNRRPYSSRARLFMVLVVLALGAMLAYVNFFSATGVSNKNVNPPPLIPPGALSGGGPATAANLQPNPGDAAVSLPLNTQDPLLPFFSPGLKVDILLDQGNSVSYVAENLRTLSVTQAGPNQHPQASPAPSSTPGLHQSQDTLQLEVAAADEVTILSVVGNNPNSIHYAIVGVA